ncbi:MAG TPA: putative sulfate exporter family transporter [Gaiellaceae bacterium]|nr:putative sulfate exporter family transporter [Gaiellaceae bacterium]
MRAPRFPVASGLAVAVVLATVATVLGRAMPVIGSAVIAIVLGVLVRAIVNPGAWATPGISFASSRLLQLAIVLLGTGLSLGTVLRVGAGSLPVMLVTLAAALGGGFVIGRALGIDRPLRTLLAVGTGICGASAIAAVATVLEVEAVEIAYAISTIFVFNIAAVLLFPPVGHLLGLGQHGFGLWAGTAVNDTSSVVAAGYAYGHAAGAYAVVVKLTRTTLIVPIVLGLAVLERRRAGAATPSARRWTSYVPGFLVLFVVAAAANSAGLFDAQVRHDLASVALFLIAVALAAVGLAAQPDGIRAAGPRPLVLGGALWLLVATTSLTVQALTGHL